MGSLRVKIGATWQNRAGVFGIPFNARIEAVGQYAQQDDLRQFVRITEIGSRLGPGALDGTQPLAEGITGDARDSLRWGRGLPSAAQVTGKDGRLSGVGSATEHALGPARTITWVNGLTDTSDFSTT